MPMNEPGNIDHSLFTDTVTVDAPLRLSVTAEPLPAGALDQAERVLQWIAVIEERSGEDGEQATNLALRRIEAKLDLALHLLAQSLLGPGTLPLQAVRISPRGLRLEATEVCADRALLHWQPSESLPVSLKLPVRLLGREEGRHCDWAFDGLGPALEEAIERQVFRLHRRWLAQHRGA